MTKYKTTYRVLASATRDEIERQVQELADQNYVLMGPVQVATETLSGDTFTATMMHSKVIEE